MGVLVPDGRPRSTLFADPVDEAGTDLAGLMRQVFHQVVSNGYGLYDGMASLSQVRYLMELARGVGATRIAETGFNIGFSSIAFLESSPSVQVVSFELQPEECVGVAKRFVDARYPGRHKLIVGDSAKTLAEYTEGEGSFDLILVDGCHDYETVVADIHNGHRLARVGAIVVVDDLTPWFPWGAGPMRAWSEAVHDGLVKPLEFVCDGVPAAEIEGPADRVWAVGSFLP